MFADYRNSLGRKLRDAAGKVSLEDRDAAIAEAVVQYSVVRPRTLVQTLTGNAVATEFALPTAVAPSPGAYEEGFSSILSIEYPVEQTGEPTYLDAEDWTLYRDETTGLLKIRTRTFTLGNLAVAYVLYTARHQVTEAPTVADTIPATDRDAVCNYAASLCFAQLAALYVQDTDPTMLADRMLGQPRAVGYLDLARYYLKRYADALGLDYAQAAAVYQDLDVDLSGGSDRFFHPRRSR